MVDKCSQPVYFNTFMNSGFSQSSKNQRNLEFCAETLASLLRRTNKMFDIRWVASSYETVSATMNNYSALTAFFEQRVSDIKKRPNTSKCEKNAVLVVRYGIRAF